MWPDGFYENPEYRPDYSNEADSEELLKIALDFSGKFLQALKLFEPHEDHRNIYNHCKQWMEIYFPDVLQEIEVEEVLIEAERSLG